MSAFRVLLSPRVWFTFAGVVAVLALIYFAYLAAVASPEENLKDLPVALVNEDQGGEVAGVEVNLGDQIVDKVTGPDSPAAGTVEWAWPEGRDGALKGIANDEYYGAIVIPADYTGRISSLASPPTVPIAVVNEDEGAEMNGQPMALGEEVARRITAPYSPAPPFNQRCTIVTAEEPVKLPRRGDAGFLSRVVRRWYIKSMRGEDHRVLKADSRL